MRVSELSRAADVPIPTIKYYLRAGLLPPGRRTAWNQAEYTDDHVRRLHLIRTLAEIGGLRLRDIRSILDAVDDERVPVHELLGIAHRALGPPGEEEDRSPAVLAARAEVDRFLAGLGWQVSANAPARTALARALASLRVLGRDPDPKVLEPYAAVADRLAAREVAAVGEEPSRSSAVERLVIGTVVFEGVLLALRRLAQEHHSALRFVPQGRARRQ